MIKTALVLSLAVVGVLALNQSTTAADAKISGSVQANPKSPLNQDMQTLDGKDVNLAEKYAGKVVLLVNVASYCGLTKQYEQLQALDDKYGDQGLEIVGVPCNQFGNQEPESADVIAQKCLKKYKVKFDVLAKVEVNGENACPLYKSLTSKESNPESPGPIGWNFEKFLFNRNGELVARFAPKTTPDSSEVVEAIEEQLATK
jgi:glutathione peroxidase